MSIRLTALLEIPTLTLHVFEARYGGGFVAFVSRYTIAGEIIDLHVGGDSEYAKVLNSLFYASWYPKGFGNTPMEAIESLELFLQDSDFAKSAVDTKYALDMLIGRISIKDSELISTDHRLILRKHSEGPYSADWVDDLSDILDKIAAN